MTGTGARALLAPAAIAVGFAAADTYVVVLALPDMMASAGLSIDELQRAAPIISGFLLGYVAVLPLTGRIADLRGRLPVLVGSLVVFALGSLVTGASYDLASMVIGRFAQGIGAGGLVPATLALVADLYPASRRGVPLGVVGAVQELGSVLGPLYGALVLAFAPWPAIFAVNLVVGIALAVVLRRMAARRVDSAAPREPVDRLGIVLALLGAALLVVIMLRPSYLTEQVTVGLAFLPLVGSSRWLSPLGVGFWLVVVAFTWRCLAAPRPLVDPAGWRSVSRRTDLVGGGLLAVALGGVILAFATADPEVAVFSPAGPWWLAVAGAAAVLFVLRNRTSAHPLVPRGALAALPARGAVLASFFVGAALIAALVDIPIFARVTVYPESQLLAALVLVRLLAALPVGALAGGYLSRRVPAGVVTAAGMALAAIGFVAMAGWELDSLRSPWATLPLVATGLGFGLAVAPVNAALLAATADAVHGVASALLVVARMVGMLVGLGVLTTVGLRRYYATQADLPAPSEVCPGGAQCAEYTRLLKEAGLTQLQTVFAGAAVCAVLAGLVALWAFRAAATRVR